MSCLSINVKDTTNRLHVDIENKSKLNISISDTSRMCTDVQCVCNHLHVTIGIVCTTSTGLQYIKVVPVTFPWIKWDAEKNIGCTTESNVVWYIE